MKIPNSERAENKYLLNFVYKYKHKCSKSRRILDYGLWGNAIIDEERNKDSKAKKCWVLILKQGPKRRAGLASGRETKSLDAYLDEVAPEVEAEPLPLFARTGTTTFFLSDLSLSSPLGPVNSLLII